ncbi:MAG TPA: ParB/RepB/Spo0J family partition protein [Burkholderiales bacterium]|nr:ParB/RepB/Spo0J family partition protein [Burkholderiales bacterium]
MNKAKPRGLGRGLDALLGVEEPQVEEPIGQLPVTQLRPGRYQPRTQMDPESIADLAESIKAQGVIQPILVRPAGGGQYEIVAGERRWRAAKMAGLEQVPVAVREIADEAALAMALIENIQREDLNPIEEAQGIQRLIDEFGMTHDAAARAVGRSRSGVTNLLRLLALPKPVQDLVLSGQLDMGHGRALLPLPAAKQIELGHLIAARQYSVRQAEELVRTTLAPKPAPRARDRDLVNLEEELSDLLGTRVAIQSRGTTGAGRLHIDYSSLDQLDTLLAKLRTSH